MILLFILLFTAKKVIVVFYLNYTLVTLVGIVYFTCIHHKLFARNLNGETALSLSFFAIGWGQAYNRQPLKAMFFPALHMTVYSSVAYMYSGKSLLVSVLTLLGVPILSFIDARYSSKRMNERAMKTNYYHQLKMRAVHLTTYHHNHHQFALDTNILMHESDILVYLLENERISIAISDLVYNELRGLTYHQDSLTKQRAQLGLDVIEAFKEKGLFKLLHTPSSARLKKIELDSSPDEKIIGTYLEEFSKGNTRLLFFSNDKGARILARNYGMPVMEE